MSAVPDRPSRSGPHFGNVRGKRTEPSWSALTASDKRIADHYRATPLDNAFACRQRDRMAAADRERAELRADRLSEAP